MSCLPSLEACVCDAADPAIRMHELTTTLPFWLEVKRKFEEGAAAKAR